MALGCESCEFGWVQIKPETADQSCPRPTQLDNPDLDPTERERLERVWRGQLEGARNTWYPCKVCNTTMFFRWREGHLECDHVRESCADCVEAGCAPGGRRAGKVLKRGTPEGDAAYRGEAF